jgi:hypothetical protein
MLHRSLFTPVVHQPTRTTANTNDNLLERICLFAGVFEQRRTTTTVWICLCTAEVRGSNPLGSTLKMWIFAGKTLTRKKGRIKIQPFLTVTRSSQDVPHRPRGLISHRGQVMRVGVSGGCPTALPLDYSVSDLPSSAHSTSMPPSRRSMSSLMCVRINLRHPSSDLWSINVR